MTRPQAMAVDAQGNLYVADSGNDRVQKRDAKGDWSVVAPMGSGVGQVRSPSGLAVDTHADIHVADTGNNRVQEFSAATPLGKDVSLPTARDIPAGVRP